MSLQKQLPPMRKIAFGFARYLRCSPYQFFELHVSCAFDQYFTTVSYPRMLVFAQTPGGILLSLSIPNHTRMFFVSCPSHYYFIIIACWHRDTTSLLHDVRMRVSISFTCNLHVFDMTEIVKNLPLQFCHFTFRTKKIFCR